MIGKWQANGLESNQESFAEKKNNANLGHANFLVIYKTIWKRVENVKIECVGYIERD